MLRELLTTDPACIEERSPEGSGPLHELSPDLDLGEAMIAMLLAKGADPDEDSPGA